MFSQKLVDMTMEGLLEKQNCAPNRAPSALAVHQTSQTISKVKPKIRIIHVFAPEIIVTDAANFRELVQRLTGKPTDDQNNCCAEQRSRISRKKKSRILSSSNKKMEQGRMAESHAASAGLREEIKGGEGIWRGANSAGGFLGGLAEFDGFMQELNQYPILEGTTQMDDYGSGHKLLS